VADLVSSKQTSIDPVQRFNLIVAPMLLAPPGIIVQWFVNKIAAAISPAPTVMAILLHPTNMRRGSLPCHFKLTMLSRGWGIVF
jgi:hypothetical protein